MRANEKAAHCRAQGGEHRNNQEQRNYLTLLSQAASYRRRGERICDIRGREKWPSRRHSIAWWRMAEVI